MPLTFIARTHLHGVEMAYGCGTSCHVAHTPRGLISGEESGGKRKSWARYNGKTMHLDIDHELANL